MPAGPEKTEALRRAGMLRNAADVRGFFLLSAAGRARRNLRAFDSFTWDTVGHSMAPGTLMTCPCGVRFESHGAAGRIPPSVMFWISSELEPFFVVARQTTAGGIAISSSAGTSPGIVSSLTVSLWLDWLAAWDGGRWTWTR
jgi:hypothetical protein